VALKISLHQWLSSLKRLFSKGFRASQLIFITIIATFISLLLYLPASQTAIGRYRNIDTIFIAAGGMIGTVIALIFSLSIIVVQRAAETFTPFITQIYREDRKTHLIFIVLVLLCISSFLFSIDGILFGVTQAKLLPVQIMIIALTYDLSRLQYRRVSELMDTNAALNILLRKMFTHIDRIRNRVTKAANRWKAKSFPDKMRDVPIENFETALYRAIPQHTDLLGIGLAEMGEIAARAVSRGEIHIAQKAISSIRELALYYISSRKANVLLAPADGNPFTGVIVGDVDSILEPVYEHLSEINRRAVEVKSQAVCIAVVECLGGVGQHLVSIGERTQQIAWKPIGYLGICVQNAQAAQLHDVALRGSKALLRFVQAVPSANLDIRTYVPVIQLWRDIALNALVARNAVVADLILKDLMGLAEHLLREKLPLFKDAFSLILDELYRLTPFCLANEGQMGTPFSPYQMTNSNSIGYLVESSADLMTNKDAEEWLNPYDDFIDLNKKVSGHFRNVGEKFDIGDSQLVWQISETIKHISEIILRLVDGTPVDHKSWLDDLVNQVSWHISFFWATFDKATKINRYYAYSACDHIVLIAIAFYERGFSEILDSGVSAIRSIAVSYSVRGEDKSPYSVANFLQLIWHLRILAEAKADKRAIEAIDKEIASTELWHSDKEGYLATAFEERKYQLKRELIDVNPHPFDDSTSVLRRLLNQRYPHVPNQILEELYPGYHSSGTETPTE
jgi:hypothetical protein